MVILFGGGLRFHSFSPDVSAGVHVFFNVLSLVIVRIFNLVMESSGFRFRMIFLLDYGFLFFLSLFIIFRLKQR